MPWLRYIYICIMHEELLVALLSFTPPPLPPLPSQVVYVYGGENAFCAVKGVGGQEVRYLPKEAIGVAQWFGVTAFLFCVHSMVRMMSLHLVELMYIIPHFACS